jgi:hypothetical protein
MLLGELVRVEVEGFRRHGRAQQRWIEELIARGSTQGRILRRRGRDPAGDIEDPGVLKNLRIFHRLIEGAIGVCERARATPNERLCQRFAELQELTEVRQDCRITGSPPSRSPLASRKGPSLRW